MFRGNSIVMQYGPVDDIYLVRKARRGALDVAGSQRFYLNHSPSDGLLRF